MSRGWSTAGLFAAVAAALTLGGCASATVAPGPDSISDPFEGYNRAVFGFNTAVDSAVLQPVAIGYRYILPRPVRVGVRNFFDNLDTPVILVNDVFQGEAERAGITLARFTINTTLGVGGVFDWAEEWGLPRHEEDFGQTLAVWGAGPGAYLVLPFFGPSSTRDSFGMLVDVGLDPVTYVAWHDDWNWVPYARRTLRVIEQRERTLEQIADLERTSIDFYAAVRSYYYQQRESQIANGNGNGVSPDLPDDLPDLTAP